MHLLFPSKRGGVVANLYSVDVQEPSSKSRRAVGMKVRLMAWATGQKANKNNCICAQKDGRPKYQEG